MIKTGETVRDGQGSTYQIGQLLGRGLWGKSYLVRRDGDETAAVLKTPLVPEDFRGEIPGADLFFAACREAVLEQARLYEQGAHPFLPRLLNRFTLPDGQPAMVLPRFPDSLERRLAEGLPVGALLDVLLGVVRRSRDLAAGPGFHGGLRPSNVLLNDRGEIFLTDLATPSVRKHFHRLATVVPGGQPSLPPELLDGATNAWTPGVDSYAVAMMLWRGLVTGETSPGWPRNGLDKASQVALKDRVVERMKLEDSNPRFHGRFAERVAVLLARAISRETAPSPPYRFPRLDELYGRLEEVQQLVRPQVSSVGKILLDRPAAKPWFTTDEDVAFTTTVGTTIGVEGQEEIGVGIAVLDLDRDQRMRDLSLGYSVDKHPSGRYRFSFSVGGLGPGRYRARLAFAIKDSGQPPATSEADFNVRAAPGWVPRAEPPPAAPLPLRPDPVTVTQPQVRADLGPNGVALPGHTAPGVRGAGSPQAASPPAASQRPAPQADARAQGPDPRAVQADPRAHAPDPRSSADPRTSADPRSSAARGAPAADPRSAEARGADPRTTPGRGAPAQPPGPPPYTPGPKPAGPGRADRHAFDDPSITAVPVPTHGAPVVPLPIPPPERAAPLAERPAQPVERSAPAPAQHAPQVPVAGPPVTPPPAPAAPQPAPGPAITVAPPLAAPRPVAVTIEPDGEPEEEHIPDVTNALASDPPTEPPRPAIALRPVPPLPPPPPPEPVYRPRDWSQEALPGAGPSRNLDAEDLPPPDPYDDDDGPNPLARIWQQLRNDPYIAVMAGLGLIILVLLLLVLLLRK